MIGLYDVYMRICEYKPKTDYSKRNKPVKVRHNRLVARRGADFFEGSVSTGVYRIKRYSETQRAVLRRATDTVRACQDASFHEGAQFGYDAGYQQATIDSLAGNPYGRSVRTLLEDAEKGLWPVAEFVLHTVYTDSEADRPKPLAVYTGPHKAFKAKLSKRINHPLHLTVQ